MRALILSTLSGLVLVGCVPLIEPDASEEESTPVLVDDVASAEPVESPEIAPAEEAEKVVPTNVAERKTATIDWNAARADFAARDTADDGMAQVAGGGAPAVPILLPDEPVGVASVGGADALQFRPLADGYFAVQRGDVYDLVINGTDRLIARPGGEGVAGETALAFEETMTGAQVSFSRYGASYLVEFMCKDREAVIDGSCINEAEALAEVEKLLIAGTR
ncbi:MAG: hypothetical protein AAGJ68_04405 [Pseudomonadota bacterium]